MTEKTSEEFFHLFVLVLTAWPTGLRSWPLTRHPYLVFYLERPDHIDVWRVLHGQRDIPAWLLEPDSN